MNIVELKNEDYDLFMKCVSDSSFTQMRKWGEFKAKHNWKQELLGLYSSGKLLAVAQILYKKVRGTKYKLAYCSGGYNLISKEYEQIFNKKLTAYLKNKNCFVLKIDPYQQLENIEQYNFSKPSCKSELGVLKKFKKLGYKHLGFYNEFEGMQPRHTFKVRTESSYQQTIELMSNHTRRNIKIAEKYEAVKIVTGGSELVPDFYQLLVTTAKRDKFSIREQNYFDSLVETLGTDIILSLVQVDIIKLESELNQIMSSISNQLVKQRNKQKPNLKYISDLEQQLVTNQKRHNETVNYLNLNITQIFIAANLSITDGKNCWYLYGASADQFKFIKPAYMLMAGMIEKSINSNYSYYDLYGVSGVFDKNHPDYGLYAFKSGFGGDLVEYIGEFDKPINYPVYICFNKLYPNLKKIRKARARK